MVAWGRLLGVALTSPSPPRHVAFYAADGEQLDADDWICTGSAFVDREFIWQRCFFDKRPYSFTWARLNLHEARADLLWPVSSMADDASRAEMVGAVARSRERGGLVIAGRTGGVWVLRANGDVHSLGRDGHEFLPCLRTTGDRVELVYGAGYHIRHAVWTDGAGWRELELEPPPVDDATYSVERLGCYWSEPEDGWRGVWVRHPRRWDSAGPVKVEFWASGPGVEGRWVSSYQEQPKRRSAVALGARLSARDPQELVWLWTDELDRTSGGGTLSSGPDDRLFASDSGSIELSRNYHGESWSNVDYVVGRSGLQAIYATGSRANQRGRWYGARRSAKGVAFTRLDAAGTQSILPTGSPAIPGRQIRSFKWLPDGNGGVWIMEPNAKSFLHLDSSLERTDHLGFIERFVRALSTERPRVGWTDIAMFLWVLFGAPLVALPALTTSRRGVFPLRQAFHRATCLYVAVSLFAVPMSFWSLSAQF